MKKNLKNIFNLSKLFIKENDEKLRLINKKNKKITDKSILSIYIVIFIGLFYISSTIIKYMIQIGKPEIFLNAFLLY